MDMQMPDIDGLRRRRNLIRRALRRATAMTANAMPTAKLAWPRA